MQQKIKKIKGMAQAKRYRPFFNTVKVAYVWCVNVVHVCGLLFLLREIEKRMSV